MTAGVQGLKLAGRDLVCVPSVSIIRMSSMELILTASVDGDIGSIAVLEVGTRAQRHLGGDAALLNLNGGSLSSEEDRGGDGESSKGLHADG